MPDLPPAYIVAGLLALGLAAWAANAWIVSVVDRRIARHMRWMEMSGRLAPKPPRDSAGRFAPRDKRTPAN